MNKLNNSDLKKLIDIRNKISSSLYEAKYIIDHSSHDLIDKNKAKQFIGNIDIGLGNGDYVDKYEYTFAKFLLESGAKICDECEMISVFTDNVCENCGDEEFKPLPHPLTEYYNDPENKLDKTLDELKNKHTVLPEVSFTPEELQNISEED